MKDKIETCFNRLQNLDIKPTLANMEILLQTLYDLKEIYREIDKEVKTDEGTPADTE